MSKSIQFAKNLTFYEVKNASIKEYDATFYRDKVNQLIHYLLQEQQVKKVVSIIPNCIEWNIIDMACLHAGITIIPINENISSIELKRIIAENKPDIVFYKKKRHLSLLEKIQVKTSFLKLDIKDILKDNALPSYQENIQNPNNLTAFILYTSGSTTLMKGVKHSLQNQLNVIKIFSEIIKPLKVKKALSFLPLSFSGERKLNYTYQNLGINICYPILSKGLLDNILFFKPEIMAIVPSLLEDLINQLEEREIECSLKYLVCGGANIAAGIKAKYKRKNIEVIEVYGLSETASIGTVNHNNGNKQNSAGLPLPNVKIHIDKKNEIYIHTSTLFNDYVSKPSNCININHLKYFKTGDKGYIDEDGFLYITGRIANGFKLKNGTWLQPEEIEEELMMLSNDFVDQVVITKINQELTGIFITNENEKKIDKIVNRFNNNSFIYIEDFRIIKPDFLKSKNIKVKFLRNEIINHVVSS